MHSSDLYCVESACRAAFATLPPSLRIPTKAPSPLQRHRRRRCRHRRKCVPRSLQSGKMAGTVGCRGCPHELVNQSCLYFIASGAFRPRVRRTAAYSNHAAERARARHRRAQPTHHGLVENIKAQHNTAKHITRYSTAHHIRAPRITAHHNTALHSTTPERRSEPPAAENQPNDTFRWLPGKKQRALVSK